MRAAVLLAGALANVGRRPGLVVGHFTHTLRKDRTCANSA
jgi:hypothetical protein